MSKTVLENYHLECECGTIINEPFCSCEKEGFDSERDFIRPEFDGVSGLDKLAELEERYGRTLDLVELCELTVKGVIA